MTTADSTRGIPGSTGSTGSTAPTVHTIPATRASRAQAGQSDLDGKIEVSARAIATIAARAATACPGVAGLAPRHGGLGPLERLAVARAAHGVEARFVNDHVVVEVWVTLERGVRVIEVAHAIMICVKYAVEEALGLRVAQVNVNVQALASPR